MVPLNSVLDGWEKHNALLVKMISPLREEDLALFVGKGLWSVRVLACHIVSARAWWFGSWMHEGGEEFERLVTIDDDELETPTRDAGAICAALDSSWAEVARCLQNWSDADLDTNFQRPEPNAAGERPTRDRRYIIWHVVEHDVHHGGEISLTLGMHGRKGLDL